MHWNREEKNGLLHPNASGEKSKEIGNCSYGNYSRSFAARNHMYRTLSVRSGQVTNAVKIRT